MVANNFIALLSKEVEQYFRMVFVPTTRQVSEAAPCGPFVGSLAPSISCNFPHYDLCERREEEEAAVAVKWPRAREEEVEKKKKKAVTMAGCRTEWFIRI